MNTLIVVSYWIVLLAAFIAAIALVRISGLSASRQAKIFGAAVIALSFVGVLLFEDAARFLAGAAGIISLAIAWLIHCDEAQPREPKEKSRALSVIRTASYLAFGGVVITNTTADDLVFYAIVFAMVACLGSILLPRQRMRLHLIFAARVGGALSLFYVIWHPVMVLLQPWLSQL